MLHIALPSDGPANLTFTVFEDQQLPAPINGVHAEVNNDVVLLFDDEEEAVTYMYQLEELVTELDDQASPAKAALDEIIDAINNDEFVQTYLEENR